MARTYRTVSPQALLKLNLHFKYGNLETAMMIVNNKLQKYDNNPNSLKDTDMKLMRSLGITSKCYNKKK